MIEAEIRLERHQGFSLNVSLQLGDGITALYGTSGSGKTSILRTLAGLESGSSTDNIRIVADGEIWQDEKEFVPTHQRSVGYIFQQPQLFTHLTVAGNLKYAAKRCRSSSAPAIDEIVDWLELRLLLDKSPSELSGGEAQRVAIGRSLANGSTYLLLDEPLGSLDRARRMMIMPYLSRLNSDHGIPMVYVSHSREEVNYLADDVYFIDSGRVTGKGTIFDTSSSLEFNRSEGDELNAVIQCHTKSYDESYHLVELKFGSQALFVAADARKDKHWFRQSEGKAVRVRIPARDVSITLTKPVETSIINIVRATVDSIDSGTLEDAGASALVRLETDEQYFFARITKKSLIELNLSEGHVVYAQIKGVALVTDA